MAKANTKPAAHKRPWTLERSINWILFICGVVGFLASFILMLHEIQLLKDPSYVPECNINPIISCGSAMSTTQASIFGFANALIGIAGFAGIATIGAARLAGAQFKRWFWLGLQGGVLFGVGFVSWLQFQTIFNLNTLCPYCMVVWCSMIPLFWYVTLYNLREKHIPVPNKLRAANAFIQRNHGNFLALWFASLFTVILWHFWYYWSTLI